MNTNYECSEQNKYTTMLISSIGLQHPRKMLFRFSNKNGSLTLNMNEYLSKSNLEQRVYW